MTTTTKLGVICRMFIQVATQQPDGSTHYTLGAVCRGEENKHWAAATPGGTLKHGPDPVLDEIWLKRFDPIIAAKTERLEVHVQITPDEDGDWKFDACSFSYGGCTVVFRGDGQPYGRELTLTINASEATKTMREAYANSLLAGAPARFRVNILP